MQQLTIHPGADGIPCWSSWDNIFFSSNRTGYGTGIHPCYHMDIWVMNSDGTDQHFITDTDWRDDYDISFHNFISFPRSNPIFSLGKITFCRTGETYSTLNDSICGMIVWKFLNKVKGTFFRYIYNAPIFPNPIPSDDTQCPDYSPNGFKIAFNSANKEYQIWEIDIFGNIQQITKYDRFSNPDIKEVCHWPDYCPVGPYNKMAFQYSYGSLLENHQIHVINLSKASLPVSYGALGTDFLTYGTNPAWSPDGSLIAYSHEDWNGTHIWVIGLTDRSINQVTNKANITDLNPTWSPDGKYLAFYSNRSGNWDIWRTTKEYTHPKTPQPVDWWPMFHHDIYNSGYNTDPRPLNNNTLWNFSTGKNLFSPAVVDDTIYFSAGDELYSLNATNKGIIWVFTAAGPINSSPAVEYGNVYFGADDTFYCLDPVNLSIVWDYKIIGGFISSSPVVTDDKVYIGVDHPFDDMTMYCFDAYNGSVIWRIEIPDVIYSSPAVADIQGGLLVYVGTQEGLYCLDAIGGGGTTTVIWSYLIGPVKSSPAIGTLHYTSGDIPVVYFGSDDGNIYCLNAMTGGPPIWSYSTGGPVFSSPAVAYDLVYIGSYDKNMYCLDAYNGTLLWKFLTGDPVDSSPAVANWCVYIGSNDGKIYCLDAIGGGGTTTVIWDYMRSDGWLDSPAIANGRVYIGSAILDGKMYCFGT